MINKTMPVRVRPLRWSLVLLVLALAFSVTACSGSSFPKAEESVNGFFQALSEANLESATSYCASGSDNFSFTDPQEEKFVTLLVQKTTHEIVSSVEEGSTATVTVKVTNLDLEQIFEEVMSKATDEMLDAVLAGKDISDEESIEMTMKYLEEGMSAPDAPLVTNDLTITLNKDNSKKMWVIVDDDAFVNGITGNMNAMF
ncbi:hypothetical protein U6B65_05805 [Oscillospiraceae bacterium MB08-C2-2]|nr:hypothetical protein U6B65_05805 [Oscillospiraceae bacterium MB08-C2-2]